LGKGASSGINTVPPTPDVCKGSGEAFTTLKGRTPISPKSQSWHPGRSLPLDLLRGIAILLVLGRHSVLATPDLGPLTPFAVAWKTIGWAGVDLFFVLSGFLVSGLFFAEYRQRGQVDVRRFMIRRGFKIWPPYLIYLNAITVWIALRHHAENPNAVWADLWPNFLHVQNYFHTPRIHTWSLAVEEHFYLGLALLFLLFTRLRGIAGFLRWLPGLIIGGVMTAAVLRHLAYLTQGPEKMNLYATHLRWDGLLIGTLLAYGTHFHANRLQPLRRYPLTLILTGLLLASPTLRLSPEASPWSASLGMVGVYAGFGLILLGTLELPRSHARWENFFAGRTARLLGQIGFYSYSIYLWHIDLVQVPLQKLLPHLAWLHLPEAALWVLITSAYVILAILGGRWLAHGVERPSLRLREHLFPSTTPSSPLVTTP
jgi:peptidoglycan/LPS O-acetylase OafA/YrhL